MCGTLLFYSGWRLYMEDAHLSITPFTKKNFSLFAVFDGHGGIPLYIQALKLQLLPKGISQNS